MESVQWATLSVRWLCFQSMDTHFAGQEARPGFRLVLEPGCSAPLVNSTSKKEEAILISVSLIWFPVAHWQPSAWFQMQGSVNYFPYLLVCFILMLNQHGLTRQTPVWEVNKVRFYFRSFLG